MRFWITVLLLSLFLISCENDKGPIVPDVSEVQIDYDIIRYDQEMKTASIEELEKKYPAFSDKFFKHIIPVKRDPNPEALFDTIRSQKEFLNLVDTCQIAFSNFDKLKEELDQSFKFLKYYLPAIDIPDIYTIVSGFAYQRFLLEDEEKNNIVGIGLDMFLGGTFPYSRIALDNPAFSNYLTRSFNKDHLPKKLIELLLEDHIPKPKGSTLLDQMVYNGKKLYLLDRIIPYASDTIVMEYTNDQWNWIQNNEIEIWAYFLKEKLFYETSNQKIGKYVNPSPHSPGMPPGAPGRTANYIGWQIVEHFMKRNPETQIEELVALDDAQKILEKSKYKPSK